MFERIKTAIILLIIVGIAMFATRSLMLIIPLLMAGSTIAAYEWAKLIPNFSKFNQQKFAYIYATLILLTVICSLLLSSIWVIWWIIASLLWLVAIQWVSQYPHNTQLWYGKQLFIIGIIIITASLTAMFYLWQKSAWWLLYVFVLVWCADSGAYFIGRKFGKRKMSPAVSPNKSIEGLIGGLATGSLVVFVVSFGILHWTGLTLILFLALSLFSIIMSVFGDLFESMLKRYTGVKDSGSILPGHGGILDRIDSQLSTMPIFALGFWLMNYFGLINY